MLRAFLLFFAFSFAGIISSYSQEKNFEDHSLAIGNSQFIETIAFNQRAGISENYGLSVRHRRNAPVRVRWSELLLTENENLLLWFPKHKGTSNLDTLNVIFKTPPANKMISKIGFVLEDGSGYAVLVKPTSANILNKLGIENSIADELKPDLENIDYAPPTQEMSEIKQISILRNPVPTRYLGEHFILQKKLPASVVERLKTTPIKYWFLQTANGMGKRIDVVFAGLKKSEQPFAMTDVGRSGELRGKVVSREGWNLKPGTKIRLRTEKNMHAETVLNKDGSFSFNDVPRSQPISLSLEYLNEDFYAEQGRWFIWRSAEEQPVIRVVPNFEHAAGAINDVSKSSFIKQKNNPFHSIYKPNTRFIYAGWKGREAEYLAHSFTNNFGFHDSNRFATNPDKCLRMASIGPSVEVSLQVQRWQKFNAILEADIGVALGRCVEVISAGMDSGNLGSYFRIVRDYVMRFEPKLITFDLGWSAINSINPVILRKAFGISPKKNKYDNFYFDEDGQLKFRKRSKIWPRFAKKKEKGARFDNGMGVTTALWFPISDQPPAVAQTWKYLREILAYYQNEFPQTKFGLHTISEVTKLYQDKIKNFTLSSGKKTKFSRGMMSKNIKQFCAENDIFCIIPIFPDKPNLKKRKRGLGMVWKHDGHLNERGHQIAARMLIGGIVDELTNGNGVKIPPREIQQDSKLEKTDIDLFIIPANSNGVRGIDNKYQMRACIFGGYYQAGNKQQWKRYIKRISPRMHNGVRLRRFPWPYRSMIAISSDADRNTYDKFVEYYEYFNGREQTKYGTGLGLDMAHSFFSFSPRNEWSLQNWGRKSAKTLPANPSNPEIAKYIKKGWIDTFHSYGGFSKLEAFKRPMAKWVLDFLKKEKAQVRVWTNHGNLNRNADSMCAIDHGAKCSGDIPGKEAYHTDITLDYGLNYIWDHRFHSSTIGYNSTLAKMSLRDRNSIWGFSRFNGCAVRIRDKTKKAQIKSAKLWHMQLFNIQSSKDTLNYLVDNQLFSIFGQHFVCANCGIKGARPLQGPIPQAALDGMRRLKEWQDRGLIVVARTVDLLRYNRMLDQIIYTTKSTGDTMVIDINKIDDSILKDATQPNVHDLRGITFQFASNKNAEITIAGAPVKECLLTRHKETDGTNTIGFKWLAGQKQIEACQ